MTLNSCTTKTDADILLHNGKIYTSDSAFSVKEAMVVKDGKILETGSYNEMITKYNIAEDIDLQGLYVYPGFIDAHCHFYGYSLTLQQADLNGALSFEEVIERLKTHQSAFNQKWLLGRGWDQNIWENREFPTNELLNKNFPDIPVVITRVDGHVVIANDKALEIAGINSDTKIEGGKILLKDGKITGILLDKAADKMKEIIPVPQGDDLSKLMIEAEKRCTELGLTSVADAGLDKDIILQIEDLQNKNKLKINVYAMLNPSEENIGFFVKKGYYDKSRLHVHAIKLYADGALGSRGACLLEPYSDDSSNSGIMVESIETLRHFCNIAYQNNYQVCTHAIGDSAVRVILGVYAEFLKGKNDRRWRIEHAQVVNENDFEVFSEYNIVPSVQPTHATSDMKWAANRIGDKRIKNAYAYKKLLKQNGWIPFGTDFPIEKIDPLLTFFAAVFRKDENGYPEGGFQPENAVTREDALKGITIWAARSCFLENESGSLEPGKYADFVILDKDIITADEKEILKTQVLKTYIRGEIR